MRKTITETRKRLPWLPIPTWNGKALKLGCLYPLIDLKRGEIALSKKSMRAEMKTTTLGAYTAWSGNINIILNYLDKEYVWVRVFVNNC